MSVFHNNVLEKLWSKTLELHREKQKQQFEEHDELDFALLLPGIGRFRANYYRTLGDTAAAFRIIPIDVPSLDDLGAPEVYKSLIKREKGLILPSNNH